jgi:hypothetical protein
MSVQLMPVPHPRIGAPFVAATLLVVFAGGMVTGLSLPRAVETRSQGAAAQGPAVQAQPLAPVGDHSMSDAAYAALHGGSVQTPAFPGVADHNMSDAAYAALHPSTVQASTPSP